MSPEIKHELPGDRLHESPLMPEGNVTSTLISARFEQRILHTGNLLQHGFERLPDHGWSHFLRAQVSHLLDLQQIEKRVSLGDRDERSLLPRLKLARSDPQDAQQICSAIAMHGCFRNV